MAIQEILRARGGTEERTVSVDEIVIPDLDRVIMRLGNNRTSDSVSKYRDDLTSFLAAIRTDSPRPARFFVPDLWHVAHGLGKAHREIVRDVWSLGHDLALTAGYTGFIDLDNDDPGMTFVRGD